MPTDLASPALPLPPPSIRVGPDYRVFALFAALNHYGYDLEGDPKMGDVRLAVRRHLAALPDPWREPERRWMECARPFWPRVGLMEKYALHQRDWPAGHPGPFGAGDQTAFRAWLAANVLELPCEVPEDFLAALAGLGPMLTGFAQRTGLAGLWHEHHAAHDDPGGLMDRAIGEGLGRSASLLAVRSWPFSSVRVITNLLQSRWLADLALIDSCLHAVVAAPDPSLAPSVVHEAVHLVVRPVLRKMWPQFEVWGRCAAGEAVRKRMEPQGYWGPTPAAGMYRAVQEALVRAATIAAAAGPAEQLRARAETQALRGFALVPSLARFLASRARSPLTAHELSG
ncbi:MAG: hypothetical protein Q8P31_04700, partial [Bacillota bacterium]|nr:hypothetical protein [Bacillota bacterium]